MYLNWTGIRLLARRILNSWIFWALIAFYLVYRNSLAFVYVDGDDATSVAYHLLGRNREIQPVYSVYQGMADKALSFLPPDEALLRHVSMLGTGIAAILMFVLILTLAFEWTGQPNGGARKWMVAIAALIAAPEFLFFGLVYSPTWIAMSLLLSAHLVLRRALRRGKWFDLSDGKYAASLFLSVFFFGLGVSFRWNTILYAIVISADVILARSHPLQPPSPPLKKRTGFAALWLSLALLSSVVMVWISGFGYTDLVNAFSVITFVMNQSGGISTSLDTSLKEVIFNAGLTLSPLFTPFGTLTMALGFVDFLRRRDRLALIVLAGILTALPFARTAVPKFIITALPVLVLCFVRGMILLQSWGGHGRFKPAAYSALFLVLVVPWIIGLRVEYPGTAYGPGFEIRPYDREDFSGKMRLSMVFDAGAAVPTPEGQRPLYGYGYVLLGGDWREFMLEKNAERVDVIRHAISTGYPVIVTNWSPDFYVNRLYEIGFRTDDPYTADGQYFTRRDFVDVNFQSVTLLIRQIEEGDAEDLIAHLLDSGIGSDNVIITGYPSFMRSLHVLHPEAMEAIGSISAIVELGKLR